jgi:hypothetical protein
MTVSQQRIGAIETAIKLMTRTLSLREDELLAAVQGTNDRERKASHAIAVRNDPELKGLRDALADLDKQLTNIKAEHDHLNRSWHAIRLEVQYITSSTAWHTTAMQVDVWEMAGSVTIPSSLLRRDIEQAQEMEKQPIPADKTAQGPDTPSWEEEDLPF